MTYLVIIDGEFVTSRGLGPLGVVYKIVLRIALTSLARHYGFICGEPAGARRPGAGRVRHWGADDYRPVIGGE